MNPVLNDLSKEELCQLLDAVQYALSQKGLPLHPCKRNGIPEYTLFAKTIDDRISCECLSCYPDITDDSCNCAWKFTLKEW